VVWTWVLCCASELDLVHKVTAPHQFALLPSHKPTILPAAAAALSKERETVHLATTPTFKVNERTWLSPTCITVLVKHGPHVSCFEST